MTELAERTDTAMPTFENVRLERADQVITLTMTRAKRRNSLSEDAMRDILAALDHVATTDARILVLAGEGPVFSSGHDFADMIGRDLHSMRALLQLCTDMMTRMHTIPQIVIARVHALATAAGCQLVASADLAVAAESAGFAVPGGKGGWFCHTPNVAVARNIGRKHLMELALSGEPIDAKTAEAWGLINYAVPDDQLDAKLDELIAKMSQGSFTAKALGKQALYNQIDRPERDAYLYAMEVMASASQTDHAREGMSAFVEKRKPVWPR
ncbi:enoyl-CoA hydratase-related protein [Cumulibacter manganitolerans]|uniref:enoyl-CoA hydratase-related protein n=1 Tax=Cumulibacter manganitolerans TaxID=1884992 RepID=UPI001E633975|nr:enoyl-CoA hydratase-related protein [Cumulibacter manganitolerans]